MTAPDAPQAGVAAVASFRSFLHQLLDESEAVKQTSAIEPALSASDFSNLSQRATSCLPAQDGQESKDGSSTVDAAKLRRFAIVETAARDLFDQLIATTTIDAPEFVRMWNLLDVLSILSDDGQCEPALLFWLVEELLDSQTIARCSKIFDYLESRRERITAKNFKQKQLVILRSCNELLRRLSRAENTGFCGRVFIFLFQSFPLGDRSSVNLRGEYHLENITTYELEAPEEESKMDIDTQSASVKEGDNSKPSTKGVTFGAKDQDKGMDSNSLYPRFWSLQESFSQPMSLFDAGNFTKFKENLQATMSTFRASHIADGPRSSGTMDESKRGSKRKREDDSHEDLLETFNPKYLTSRDLFELEISDLSFRRNFLVQALIAMEFLMSLSKQVKDKLATSNTSNRAVIYPQLSDDDVKWATEMKTSISDYLKQGHEGQYFYRMVETVLARDKNWVIWKMASCPPIQRDPVSSEAFNEAKAAAQRTATSKRLRPVPMASVSLDFLRGQDDSAAMVDLMSEDRYLLPELDSFKRKIADDDFEIEMPTNDDTKAAAIAGKSSKSWRALRIAGRSKLAAFDKIDDPKKIAAAFEEVIEPTDNDEEEEPAANEDDMPTNRDPIIISGPLGVGKTTLINGLLEQRKGVFTVVVCHAARDPTEGEAEGKDYYFVKQAEFNQLRDGDRLIEYGTKDGCDYGTSSKTIEAIKEAGKIPIIELDLEAAQFAKDMDFAARYILVKPSSADSLSERLKASGKDEATVAQIVAKLPEETDEAKVGELFSTAITNDAVEQSIGALANYIFAKEELSNGKAEKEEADEDANMVGA